jgi:ABC-2 type transport system permease protein
MSELVEQIRAAGGTRMTGPRAVTGDWRRGAALTWTLAYLEFRLKFFGSVLGYIWQLARPLLMFGVYYVIFTVVLHLGKGVKFYAPALLANIMIFQFFAEVTGASVGAVLNRENLVRKIHFPRIVIPLSVVVTSALNLGLNFIAVGVFMAIQGVPVRLSWLVIFPMLAMLFVLVTGLAMLLSALFVRFRDVQPIWDVVLQAGFYASPILYPIESVSAAWAVHLIMCNPLSVVIEQIRHSVFDPAAPSAADAIGGWPYLAIPVGITVATFALGFWVFNRTAPEVAENL